MVKPRLISLVALTAAVLCAQAPTEAPVIHVDTREVDVDVTVTDSGNRPVGDLKKEDFSILDNGKPRVIDSITLEREYPLISAMQSGPLHLPSHAETSAGAPSTVGHSTAIILDEVNTYFADAAQARQKVADLLSKAPLDERIALYALVRTKGLELLQDYTISREALKNALAKFVPTGLRPGGDFNADQPIPPYSTRPANDNEAAFMWRENSEAIRVSLQRLAEQLSTTPGRKSIFWITNGFHPWILGLGNMPASPAFASLDMQKPLWEKTFRALNEANVAVNAIDSRGLYRASNPVTGTIAGLREIAEQTGGKAYYGRNDIDDAIEEGIDASRTTYTLRFHLADDERDRMFHTLKISVKRPALQLFYRQGYDSGNGGKPVDLVAGKIAGAALEARTSGSGKLDASIQLPYFYTGTNRAKVYLAAETVPAAMAFREDSAGVHGQIEIVGIALRADGSEAARFADTVRVDLENQQQADAFRKTPWQYGHQFLIAAGQYTFRLEIGTGPDAAGRKEVPLSIDTWQASDFGMGAIVLSTKSELGGPASGALVAGQRKFYPAAETDVARSDHVFVYTEVYEPALSAPSPVSVTLQMRILDRQSGSVKLDTGKSDIGNYIRPGNPVIAFATALPMSKLDPGQYRLELQAGHSSGAEAVTRTLDFDVR